MSAVALLVFVLLYVPCVATLGAIKHEFGKLLGGDIRRLSDRGRVDRRLHRLSGRTPARAGINHPC
ncbi:MAG: hypothetical protein MZV64_17160 [Ignavibacteriales bacterium]|nr:hypothetical protein [Ignavibacteriales bacterium]